MSPAVMEGCWLYILVCADGSYYVGTTRHADPQMRVAEHNLAACGTAYTAARLPVSLVFVEHFQRTTDAIAAERQVKGWRREKKEALIARAFTLLPALAARGRRA
ncbi:MAG: GIY-YIG nuclease family protein [Burkholderiales bacterium]|nr:GIY-YIG nuclease family protein [Burkholderiales bacterium]